MNWIKSTEKLPPAGKIVYMKWQDGEAEWMGNIIKELSELKPEFYHTLLWDDSPLHAPTVDVETLIKLLEECYKYFYDKADADHDETQYIPNEEMKMSVQIRQAIDNRNAADLPPTPHATVEELKLGLEGFKAGYNAASKDSSGEVKEAVRKRKYKYLIERKDTQEWFRANLTGYYGYTYHGDAFGVHPDKTNDWTKDANEAFQFESKLLAEEFINKSEYLHDLSPADCEITEHEFVDATPSSIQEQK